MDNLLAAGKAKPFIIVIGNSSIPGAAGGRGGAPGAAAGAALPSYSCWRSGALQVPGRLLPALPAQRVVALALPADAAV